MKCLTIFTLVVLSLVEGSDKCPEGQKFYEDECVCLEFEAEPQESWDNARAWCKAQGGDLISVSSLEKRKFTRDVIPLGFTKNGIWMGLRYQTQSLGYYWSAKNKRLQYAYWGSTEPDITLVQSCVLMHRHSNPSWAWKNYWCTTKYSFICQYDAVCAGKDKDSLYGLPTNMMIGIVVGSIVAFIIFMAAIFLVINCIRGAISQRKRKAESNSNNTPIVMSNMENRAREQIITAEIPERTELLDDSLPPPYCTVVHTQADVEYNDLDRTNVRRQSSRLACANLNSNQDKAVARSASQKLTNTGQSAGTPSRVMTQRSDSVLSEEDNALGDSGNFNSKDNR